jgi:hypothetical protein
MVVKYYVFYVVVNAKTSNDKQLYDVTVKTIGFRFCVPNSCSQDRLRNVWNELETCPSHAPETFRNNKFWHPKFDKRAHTQIHPVHTRPRDLHTYAVDHDSQTGAQDSRVRISSILILLQLLLPPTPIQ